MRSNCFSSHPSSLVPHPSLHWHGYCYKEKRTRLPHSLLPLSNPGRSVRVLFLLSGDGVVDGYRGAHGHLARLDRRGSALEKDGARRGDFHAGLAGLEEIAQVHTQGFGNRLRFGTSLPRRLPERLDAVGRLVRDGELDSLDLVRARAHGRVDDRAQ